MDVTGTYVIVLLLSLATLGIALHRMRGAGPLRIALPILVGAGSVAAVMALVRDADTQTQTAAVSVLMLVFGLGGVVYTIVRRAQRASYHEGHNTDR